MIFKKEIKQNIMLFGLIIFCLTNQYHQLQKSHKKIQQVNQKITLSKNIINNKIKQLQNQDLFYNILETTLEKSASLQKQKQHIKITSSHLANDWKTVTNILKKTHVKVNKIELDTTLQQITIKLKS